MQLDFIFYLAPAILVIFISVYYFKKFIENEESRRSFLMMKDIKKEVLPIRLQAYERLAIFLERIQLNRLLSRVSNYEEQSVSQYANQLLNTIEREFEHNIGQQVYLSKDCWEVILSTKKTISATIIKISSSGKITSIDELKNALLDTKLQKESPIRVALHFLKNEVKKLW